MHPLAFLETLEEREETKQLLPLLVAVQAMQSARSPSLAAVQLALTKMRPRYKHGNLVRCKNSVLVVRREHVAKLEKLYAGFSSGITNCSWSRMATLQDRASMRFSQYIIYHSTYKKSEL